MAKRRLMCAVVCFLLAFCGSLPAFSEQTPTETLAVGAQETGEQEPSFDEMEAQPLARDKSTLWQQENVKKAGNPAPEGAFLDIERAEPFSDFPALDEDGYLLTDALTDDEFIHADPENGIWIYLSPVLRIEIYRLKAKLERGMTQWFEAEVWSRDPIPRVFSDNPEKPRYGHDYPQLIAREHRTILALNGDYYTFRIGSNIRLGVIIRDEKIISSSTNHGKLVGQPPLDELALFPDGRMEVRYPREMSAQEYLDAGALDVLAFGPMLLREGEMDDRIEKKFRSLHPRSAIGMIEPGHYIFLNAEGRTKSSVGVNCLFLAQRMKARGAVTAMTLDGGQTSGMFFMGTTINEPGEFNGTHFIRKQPDIIGIGFSEKVRTDRERK